uniref:Pru domain-containing protein n=1 Tax=Mesocestoides corti TaxID=53468 RepID=A0A5K3EWU6_MESCO
MVSSRDPVVNDVGQCKGNCLGVLGWKGDVIVTNVTFHNNLSASAHLCRSLYNRSRTSTHGIGLRFTDRFATVGSGVCHQCSKNSHEEKTMTRSAELIDEESSEPEAQPLLQFKAGKMRTNEDQGVEADIRKGCVYVYQTISDKGVHFCWFDRSTGHIEENLVLTPGEAEFKHVPHYSTGRVYVLNLREQQRGVFLWMQEPDSNKDSQICEMVNRFINCPPTPSNSWMDFVRGVRGLSNLSDSELQNILMMGAALNDEIVSDSESSGQASPVPTESHANSSPVESPIMSMASPTPVAITVPNSDLLSVSPKSYSVINRLDAKVAQFEEAGKCSRPLNHM